MRWLYNVAFCKGWSFKITNIDLSHSVLQRGDKLSVNYTVYNDGLRGGLAYVIFLIANPYDHNQVVFNSHRDLTKDEKQRLRLTPIKRNESADYSFTWNSPSNLDIGVFDLKVQLWNPAKLFWQKGNFFRFHQHLFYETPWRGVIEVVEPTFVSSNKQSMRDKEVERPKVFISYSWESDSHQKWVLDLADELVRFGITTIVDKRNIHPGEEITHFIERSINDSDTLLLICTEKYTDKANNRLGGVGMETVISSATFLEARETKNFIPIVRDNNKPSSEKLPLYLGSTLFVDMSTASWRAEPFQKLISAILKNDKSNK